jgi:hypothetical protein
MSEFPEEFQLRLSLFSNNKKDKPKTSPPVTITFQSLNLLSLKEKPVAKHEEWKFISPNEENSDDNFSDVDEDLPI